MASPATTRPRLSPSRCLAAARGFLLLVVVAAAGCALPSEQLTLPVPIGSSAVQTGAIERPGGVPLGDPAMPGAGEKQVYPGEADYTQPTRTQPSRATSSVNSEGVTLNLVGASIPEAAKAVLGDVLGANYIVSDKVQGSVTLQTARPVSKDSILEIFEQVLADNGAAILAGDNSYRVVSREEAYAAGKPIATRGTPGPRAPGVSTEVVSLRYVAASEMERILKSVAPQNAVSRVDSARNLLVLTGSRAELSAMVETIGAFDVDWMRNMSFGIFPIETSDPEAIAQELDTIFANDRDSPSKGIVRFVPNARMKAIVVISSRPEYLKKAEVWIKRIDLAGEATERRAYVYAVQYRPVQELAAVLMKVYGVRDGVRGNAPRDTATLGAAGPTVDGPFGVSDTADPSMPRDWMTGARPPSAGAATAGTIAGPAVGTATAAQPAQPPMGTAPVPSIDPATGNSALLPTETVTGSLQAQAPAAMLARPPLDDRQDGVTVVSDEANNALIVTATPSEWKRIKQILSQIDVIPSQLLLEATIAEVTLNDDLKFGLRWFFEKGGNEFRLTDALAGGGALAPIAPTFAGFSYFLNIPNARVVLNALSDVTNVNIVASPSLMVLNNKKAVLQIGDEVPVATKSVVTVDNPDAPIVNSIDFRHTGVLLNITPRVSSDGRVLLDIDQEVSDAKATTSSTIDSPTIQQRRIKTTVAVNDGGSVVLAGLMQDRATRTRQQVPLVGDIPVIGNAFKNKDDVIARTELLIAITPHIVKDKEQMGMIAAEFRDRMNFNTRPQRGTPPDHRETLDRITR